jgi:prepilin peptidase CpaA
MACLPTTVLVTFLGLAAAWDVRERRIPNRLVGTFALAALGLGAAAGGAGGLGRAAAGCATGLGLLLAPFALGLVEAGDAKFLSAVGAFLGPRLTMWAFLFGTAFGVPVALVSLWHVRQSPSTGSRVASVPYALPLALGTVVALAREWAGAAAS